MAKFDEFQFRNMPGFTEAGLREMIPSFVPLKSLVIHCFDPRAREVPIAVAQFFADEVYPGENVVNEAGNRVGHTATLFPVLNAGGRAAQTLQSITTMVYLFNIKRVSVVHHSFCGATSFNADTLLETYKHEHHVDISHEYDHGSLNISDYQKSLSYDVGLLRAAPGVPKGIELYGFFYNIDTGELTEMVRDVPQAIAA